MKKVYNTPVVEIIEFKAEDIIVTSVGITGDASVGDTGVDFEDWF